MCGDDVKNQVDEMVAKRLEPGDQVVELEGEGAQGAVGLVRSVVCEWGTPEVILQQVCP